MVEGKMSVLHQAMLEWRWLHQKATKHHCASLKWEAVSQLSYKLIHHKIGAFRFFCIRWCHYYRFSPKREWNSLLSKRRENGNSAGKRIIFIAPWYHGKKHVFHFHIQMGVSENPMFVCDLQPCTTAPKPCDTLQKNLVVTRVSMSGAL